MKPLLLVTELEDYAIAFANGVARHGPVTLCVPRRQFEGLARWFDPGVDLRLLDWPRHGSLRNLRFIPSLIRLARRERPDVIHLLSNNALWLNLAIPLWGPAPLVATVHDVDVHPGDRDTQTLPRWSTDLVARQSDHLVVHGEGLRRRAQERFGLPAGRVHVLSHPAVPRYAALARAEGMLRREGDRPFTVLTFGRIFAYKGLESLIRAEAALGDRVEDLRVVIAGRGDDPWAMRDLMGRPGRYAVSNRFIPDAEVARLFIDCDVVALPYLEASQSGVINVAAAFGKPMIVTDVGEIGATVGGRGMGLVVPPADPARLADAIALLAARPDLRADFGARALAWAEGPNAPEAVGADAMALYRAVVAESRAARARGPSPSTARAG
jgi:glycosyltransferase involved in cell wall biosynthesis